MCAPPHRLSRCDPTPRSPDGFSAGGRAHRVGRTAQAVGVRVSAKVAWSKVSRKSAVADEVALGEGPMNDPAAPEPSTNQHAAHAARPPVPTMPVIRDVERYESGLPFVLIDGQPLMIGWQWRSTGTDGPVFVIASRGRMGGHKILERFPLTEEGWASAWQAFARTDMAAAQKVAVRLAAREAAAGKVEVEAERDDQPVLIVTTNEVPGYRITSVQGDVFGLVVRARNYFSNLGASFRTLAGGEVAGYTRLLTDSRNQARERMWREARARGANAVVAMRFDCNEIGDIMSEVAAYGTAVTVAPIQEAPVLPVPDTS
jgi:uncharacterized protein YbjQ (UPF0145 family)